MKKYAQIVNNKVHGIFEYEVLPQFDDTIVMIDITNLSPEPTAGEAYVNGKFIAPTPPTLDENKASKIKALQDKFQAQYNKYLAQYPKAEVASFNDKQREAVAYTINNKADTPIIDGILAGLGSSVTKADFVAAILAKVKILSQQEGTMIKTRSAIKACTTQADLDKIII